METEMINYKAPYNVVCPKCFSTRGVRCTEPVRDGSKFTDEPHEERVTLADKGR